MLLLLVFVDAVLLALLLLLLPLPPHGLAPHDDDARSATGCEPWPTISWLLFKRP